MSKPLFEIDVSSTAQSSLEAHAVLATIDPGSCHHLSQQLRLPLGIYNVSVSRIAERVLALQETRNVLQRVTGYQRIAERERAAHRAPRVHGACDLRSCGTCGRHRVDRQRPFPGRGATRKERCVSTAEQQGQEP